MSTSPPLLDQLARGDALAEVQARLVDDADTLTRGAYHDAVPDVVRERLQLLAVGGYGRREVFPHADLDIILVYDGDDGDEASAPKRLEAACPGATKALAAFFDAMRDSGARIAPRVRALPEHRRLIAADVTIGAAALDARPLDGPPLIARPLEDARTALATGFVGGVTGFCELIHRGVRDRHERFGGTTHLLEPQLKMGRGGLRDGHAVWWTAGLRFGTHDLAKLAVDGHLLEPDRAAFDAAYRFVARTRLCAHAASQWRNDRLAFALQPAVARAMGFGDGHGQPDVQAFLSAFYEHAETLATTSLTWLDDWASPVDLPVLGPDGLLTRGDRVVVEADALASLADAADLLLATRDAGLRPHPETFARLRELAQRTPARDALGEDAQRLLAAAVLTPAGAPILQWLVEGGLLGVLIPEWVHLIGHASHDVYHVFTTDRHLLESLAVLDRLDDESPEFVRRAHRAVVGRGDEPALRLATLVHDIGKGLGGDHSIIGAGMTREIASRAGLDADAADLARWLVLEHLRMARTSTRRDPGDPATAAAFLAAVPDTRHLDALVVLTWADMTSVGPALRTGWKRDLLGQLDASARRAMAGFAPDPAQWLRVIAGVAETSERATTIAQALPERRWSELLLHEVDVVARLLRARLDGAASAVETGTASDPGRRLLGVVCVDRRGLLADLTAAVAAEGGSILRARVFTTPGGAAVDVFEIDAEDAAGQALPERRWERLVRALEQAAAGTEPRATPRVEARLADAARPPVATEVVHAATMSEDGLEVFEVKTRDATGLLSFLADAFDALHLDIVRSLIAVEGDRAIDTFFVRNVGEARIAPAAVCDALRTRLEDRSA